MTIPSRVEAAAILAALSPAARLARHSRAVAEVAGWLARRAATRGVGVDRRLAETAALLHDVDKALPRNDPSNALPHGKGSAAWLDAHGRPELAPIVADHPVTRLRDGAWFEAWLREAPLEARIVAYADKRATQGLAQMDARFAEWDRRYRADRPAEERRAVRARADRLERDVCDAVGCRPEEVGRLRWTAAAFGTARASRTGLRPGQAGPSS